MLARMLIDALLPPGTLWQVEEGRELDDLLNGIGQCLDTVRLDLLNLARVRDPRRTTMLADLEREFGVIPSSATDEDTRRARLAGIKASRNGDSSPDCLQAVLTAAGFTGVHVYPNAPVVDPSLFVYYAPSAICGNSSAIVGASSVGGQRGALLVNSGSDTVAPAGADPAGLTDNQYILPADPGYWPLFFFVAGAATRDGSGAIIALQDAEVPATRRAELITLILRCKPMHAWAALRINFI